MKPKRRQVRLQKRRRSVRSAVRKAKPSEYPAGLEAGYNEGLRSGYESFGNLFEGTSIIIPSYNQVDYLKQCIDSIGDHTRLLYEIIVVDNASTDGTADYLKKISSQVRYRVLETNRGFAGAINIGMMMAKGTTLLLLNNDTIVTKRWLENMLDCLNSDPLIGMVGPVTNYISGDQRIEVPYKNVADMPAFAQHFNIPDPAKWQRTDRLTGFCLLLRRELWERTGFMDEGFKVGNYEDDDYNIRVRLQGYSLVIARDTFIHHYGSVSMKALGEKLTEVNNHNMHVYMDKWGNPHELIHNVKEKAAKRAAMGEESGQPQPLGETAFFPQNVVIRGVGETPFWVQGGIRRPVTGELALPVIRLSQIDLRRWPLGDTVTAEEVGAHWHGQGGAMGQSGGLPAIGTDGVCYVVEQGMRRKAASKAALEAWGLHLKPIGLISDDQMSSLPEGLPIIAPVRVSANL
ncbi:glycosyltransferase family 2 protein [Paenibacillus solisilvae]|uniref:Glycosyltransferase family 2 protein n=1 Tax=Paenibacillus solisilvae TaxID=2486751 RepID=A0ABW0VS17_9BACL